VSEHLACDVCSRTILKGEETHEYVTPQGQRLNVCVLCRSRAEASGWIPAEQYGTIEHQPPSRARRGQALRSRLGRAAERARASARQSRRADKRPERPESEAEGDAVEPTPAPPVPTQRGSDEPEPRDQGAEASEASPGAEGVAGEESAGAEKTAGGDKPRTAKPKRRPRQQAKGRTKPEPAKPVAARPAPRPRRGPEAIMRQAVERFNSSEEPRKVAGLIRSLGAPQAAVRPDQGRQLALVTVAWELSWYQWEVNGNGDDETVREVAKGKEVSELADDARAWNAAVAEDGTLDLGAARQRQPSAKEA
jgi:hypothetical protein